MFLDGWARALAAHLGWGGMTLTDLGLEQKNLSFKVGGFLMQATGILVQVMVKKMSNRESL